jgi:hypothetical protein
MAIAINRQYISQRNINGTGNPCTYIVIHETDNTNRGANAKAHASAQYNGHFTDMSVHYYTDKDGVYQAAEHTCKCWHVGRTYVNNPNVPGCTNSNSIGIEICVPSDGDYTKARMNAIALVQHLIQSTGIPASRVIRHYDAKGKYCPRNMLDNPALWTDFKAQIGNQSGSASPGTPGAVDRYYRVGTSWTNGICNGQIGAYTVLANAKASCRSGYHVFDWSGNSLYSPSGDSPSNPVIAAQTAMNRSFGMNLTLDGIWGSNSQDAWNQSLQMALNKDYNAGLNVDGIIGTKTKSALPTIRMGDNNLLVGMIQIFLYSKAFSTDGIDCSFGQNTKNALEKYQQANNLTVDGIVGVRTWSSFYS